MSTCLLIANNAVLTTQLTERLEQGGFDCDHAPTTHIALELLTQHRYQVLLLDRDAQVSSATTFLRTLRSQGIDTPVLVMSKRASLADKADGFNAGADDYLVKPFAVEELFLRSRALASRRTLVNTPLHAGPLVMDTLSRTCLLNEQPVQLTPTNFRLLETLLRESPDPVSQEQLSRMVWGEGVPDSNRVRVHIHRLRQALKPHRAEWLIKTLPGYGFAIDARPLHVPDTARQG